MDGFECAGCYFYSNFDSANLHKVEYIPPVTNAATPTTTLTGKQELPDLEFNLWTRPDCGGTEFENANRTWFYFGVRCTIPWALIKFNMVDLNNQAKLYSQGMGPVYKMVPGKPQWERICDKPTYTSDNNVFTLSFKVRAPENVHNMVYLAFTYPYSYQELQHKLELIDKRFARNEGAGVSGDGIYYVRECVCSSLEGRRVDLITVTSHHGITAEREPRLANLFPDHGTPRPFRFVDKKVIFVSARVHPGETPSSFVFNGLLNLLLAHDDHVATVLRRTYVFKLIPCLNPDGVYNGHYRTDTKGVNLNRVYLNPGPHDHPSIYAARALVRYHHYGYEKEVVEAEDGSLLMEVSHMTLQDRNNKNLLWCGSCKSNFAAQEPIVSGRATCQNCGQTVEINDNHLTRGDCVDASESGLFLYLDMHGHASKKGIFMYGNHFDDVESSVKCMLLPKIMSINNHNFHFTACNFTERNMYLKDKRDGMSKEGSGRVAVFKLTGLIQSYTLECNYNTGRLVNILPPTVKETSKTHNVLVPPKYNPSVFEEVGKAIGYSILDLTSQNPLTRLPHSEYHSLNGLREWLRQRCAGELGETRKSPDKSKIRQSASLHAQGKAVRSVLVKTRSLSKYAPKKVNMKPLRSPKLLKKEKPAGKDSLSPQPSCSHVPIPPRPKARPSKSLTSQPRAKPTMADRQRPAVNHIARNKQTAGKAKTAKSKGPNETDTDRVRLKEICYVRDGEAKKVIARYENDKCEDDDLVVAWTGTGAKPQVFTHRSRVPPALLPPPSAPMALDEARRAFRVHNFQKGGAPFARARRNKRAFRRLASTTEMKKKLLKKKSRKEVT